MNKNNRFNDEDFPICRFGPGGDFVTDWPYKVESKASRQPIGSALKAIAKMLDTVITEELLQSSTIEKINLAINGELLTADLEDEIDINKSNESDAPPVSSSETNRQLQKEPMLFDNASGAGGIIGHKQNHSIRTCRRPKRKKIAFGQSWQGSLFEPHDQSTKVA